MIQEPTLKFMAIRLRRGGRQQFIANWPLKMILFCLGSLAKDATQGSGLRLNHRRVRKLANEWIGDSAFPIMPPLLVLVEKNLEFTPLAENFEAGFGTLSLPLAKIIDVCDGIHRIAALKLIELSDNDLIASEWPVEFVECDDEWDAEQLTEKIRNESSLRSSARSKPKFKRELTP